MAKKQTPADKPADSANATTDTQRTAPENPEPSTAPSDANVEEGAPGPPQDNPPTDLPPKLGQETVDEVVQPLTTPEVDTKGDSETSQDALNKQAEQGAEPYSENTAYQGDPKDVAIANGTGRGNTKADYHTLNQDAKELSSEAFEDKYGFPPSPAGRQAIKAPAVEDLQYVDHGIVNPDQLQAKAAGQQLTGDTMNERIEKAKEIGWKNLDRESQTSLMNELFDDADTLEQQRWAGELHRAQTFADMWQDTADMLANKMLNYSK